MQDIKKQTYIYYIFNFLNRFMVYLPVFVLFLNKKGFNQTMVMALMSVYNISIMIGEIPTGVVADKISRKLSVIVGCLLQGIAMMCMIPSSNFVVLAIIEAVFGIGLTFQSGAMSAMFYDYLKKNHKENMYPQIEGKRWACVFLSQAIASLLGGELANVDISLTVLITACAYIFSAIILIFFKEEKNEYLKSENKYIIHVAKTGRNLFATKKVKLMFVVIVVTNTLFSTTMWLYQPYYTELGIKVETYGVAYLLMNAVSALGGLVSTRINLTFKKSIIFYMLGNGICVLLMGVCRGLIGVIIPSMVFGVNGIANPWIQSYWEQDIQSEERATASSILSLISSIIYVLVAIPLGYICDNNGVCESLFAAAIVFLVVCVLCLMVLFKGEKSNEL